MTLDRLSQITEVGIKSGITLRNINVENAYVSGVVTATTLNADNYSGNATGRINPSALNVTGVATFQGNVFHGDGDIAYFGDGQDLLIFHNSTDSIIRDNGTGDLFIEGGNRIKLTNPTGIETYAVFNQDGASELWYDNAKKFETTGAGVSITGIVSATSFSGNSLVVSGMTTATGGIQVGATTSIVVGSSFIRNNAVGLGTTSTTGRNAGVGTATGTLIFNSSTGSVEVYTGNNWVVVGEQTGSINVEILLIGGGGGGAADHGGGGGAGALFFSSSQSISGPAPITIGTGGGSTPNTAPAKGGDTGGNSSISSTSSSLSITSPGGGGGRTNPSTASIPGAGGSGGGGSLWDTSGGTATGAPGGTNGSASPSSGWGNSGGTGSPTDPALGGGGGGGAGGAGGPVTGPRVGGAGGSGLTYSITGSSVGYAGGGGGYGDFGNSPTNGVPFGGGQGSSPTQPVLPVAQTQGDNGTGGGGGALRPDRSGGPHPVTVSNGGDGVCIIAYPGSSSRITFNPSASVVTSTSSRTGFVVHTINAPTIITQITSV